MQISMGTMNFTNRIHRRCATMNRMTATKSRSDQLVRNDRNSFRGFCSTGFIASRTRCHAAGDVLGTRAGNSSAGIMDTSDTAAISPRLVPVTATNCARAARTS